MRQYRTTLLFLFSPFFGLLSTLVHADFQAGLEAYNQGDYSTALKEWQPLAEQGDASAQRNLGILYRNGIGVAHNFGEALHWFRKAAEQGVANAQFDLAVMLSLFESAFEDPQEAVHWYRLAAEQGHARAQSLLGFMYEHGYGVPQDFVHAHMWFNLGAAQGDKGDKKQRDSLANRMTPAQIAEAQRLAREWLAEHQP